MLQTPTFWVAVAFVILMAVLVFAAKPLWKGAIAGLDARSAAIAAALEEAKRLHEEAQRLLAEYQRKQRDSAAECEALVAAARTEAERFAAEAAVKLQVALERRRQLAVEKIAQAEAEALLQVRHATVEVAVEATRRLLAGRMDPSASQALVDDAIRELPDKLH